LSPERRRRALVVAVVVVSTLTSLVLRMRSPLWIIPEAAYDDALFSRLAGSLLDHVWLGPYDNLTLAKGPGYPFFIAAAYELHLPLALAQHLLHLVAAAVAGLALARMTRSTVAGVGTYAILALDPAYLGASASKVSREAFYGSLSLLLFGGVVLAASWVPALVRRRAALWIPVLAVVGLALGVVLAGYHLTREERVWLYPALAIAVVAGLVSWRDQGRLTRRHLAACACLGLLGLAGFVGGVRWVEQRNLRAYGTRVTNENAEGAIAEAYVQWQRIEAGAWQRHVPVSREQRQAAYEVSPAARRLAPVLESPTNPWMGLMGAGCTPQTCEYSGAFFVWAMRNAAFDRGLMSSGGAGQRFFGDLAQQIEDACGEQLRCASPVIGSFPPPNRLRTAVLWDSYLDVAANVLTYEVADPHRAYPSGNPLGDWDLMTRALRGVGERDDFVTAERDAVARQRPVSGLEMLYRWGVRMGAVLALVGMVAALLTRDGRARLPVILLCLGAFAAVLTRVLVVAAVDATAYPAVGIGVYVLPGFSFLLLYVCGGIWLLGEVVRTATHGRADRGASTAAVPEPGASAVLSPSTTTE
jgi:hypothetical protein